LTRHGRGRLADLHVRLRTEGGTPLRRALAVGLGTAVGCTPLFGLHFLLSTVLARLFGLSRVIAYLAANVNNPFTLPLILWIEVGIGHWLIHGEWSRLAWRRLPELSLWSLGRDLALGSVVLGLLLGACFAAVTYVLGAGRRDDAFTALREAASELYLEAGMSHWEFVRGKLHFDPVYRRLLAEGHLPLDGRLVDLGCGRGILLALLSRVDVSRASEGRSGPGAGAGDAPPPEPVDSAAAPSGLRLRPGDRYVGVELSPRLVRVACIALGEVAEIRQADLAECEVPPCSTAVLLDVLHYLSENAQEDLLRRTAEALAPGGLLVVREADAGGGFRYALTRASERLRALSRGHVGQRFRYRKRAAWHALLASQGLAVEDLDAAEGTPFSNVLFLARKPAETAVDG